jgi:hypothetical protein
MSPGGSDSLGRVLLLINALATGAAAVVLAIAPSAIPATIGLVLRPEEFVLSYFLAGSEAAICLMCLQGFRVRSRSLRIVLYQGLIGFHAVTAALSLVGIAQGTSPTLIWNVGLRIGLVCLLIVALLRSKRRADGHSGSDRQNVPEAGEAHDQD